MCWLSWYWPGRCAGAPSTCCPSTYDEDDYLRAGQEFAHLIRTGDWPGFLHTNYRPEHPPLAKIAYGVAILDLPEQPLISDVEITAAPASSLPHDLLQRARTEAAVFGTLTAGLLALLNPIGRSLSRHPHLHHQIHRAGYAGRAICPAQPVHGAGICLL